MSTSVATLSEWRRMCGRLSSASSKTSRKSTRMQRLHMWKECDRLASSCDTMRMSGQEMHSDVLRTGTVAYLSRASSRVLSRGVYPQLLLPMTMPSML